MRFEWDDAKDRSNQQKHGLSFSEAIQLFQSGQDYLEIFDVAHSQEEDRFIAIGELHRGVAVVIYTERDEDVVRIIGARMATNRERDRFREHMDQYR
ncbi:MAG: BrnT family toxin [Pseudomonadales bacterium]